MSCNSRPRKDQPADFAGQSPSIVSAVSTNKPAVSTPAPAYDHRLLTFGLEIVRQVARQLARRSPLDYDDLVQEGSFGLMKALSKYKPRDAATHPDFPNGGFGRFARRKIVYAMLDAIERHHRHAPPMPMDPCELRRVSSRMVRGTRVDAATGNVTGGGWADAVDGGGGDAAALEAADHAQSLLRRLPRRLRQVVELVYGIGGGNKPMRYEDAGALLGCSKQRIEQIMLAAMGRLRELAAGDAERGGQRRAG